ncbi:sperm-associated acrosin inhibitor-like isoform X1 [Eubalaena glacialis]|uniref:sperm-associated acrosin inhibitor-like isoform X1 n=1 Tax=Eubalaena glacialis TaxID=27606 RepID=UPI002A5AF8D9|nr:sperm-associated acrosin inhibitor-like isoform X1 [Eubalaena glacialis]
MSLFSSWIKVIFIIGLAFPLYFVLTANFIKNIYNRIVLQKVRKCHYYTKFKKKNLASHIKPSVISDKPECNVYVDQLHFCTREMDPICATNGRTYSNKCVFCSEKLENSGKFDFSHWGCC